MIMINKNPDPKVMLKQLGRDAINLLAMCSIDSAAEVKPLEAGIRLLGKAWDLPEEDVQTQLNDIAEERENMMFQIPEDALPEDELLNSYDGAKIMELLWGLFNTAAQLDDKDDRNAILKLEKYMADYLDLDGWIMEKEFSIQIVTEIKRT